MVKKHFKKELKGLKKEFIKGEDKPNWERIFGFILMLGTFGIWVWGVIAYDTMWGTWSKIVWAIFCLIMIIDFSTWGKK